MMPVGESVQTEYTKEEPQKTFVSCANQQLIFYHQSRNPDGAFVIVICIGTVSI